MQPKRTGGWISLWREIQQFELWPGNRNLTKEPFTRFEAWIDILLSASYEDHVFTLEGKQLEERRGEWVVSIRYLSSRWGWSKEKVANFLRFLNRLGEIDHSTGSITGRIPGKIIVIKYDNYQTHGVQSRTHKRTHKEGEDDMPEAAASQQEPVGRIPDAYTPHPEPKSENRAAKNGTKQNKIINNIAGLDESSSEEYSSHPDYSPSGDVSKEPQDLVQIEKRAGTAGHRSSTTDGCSAADPSPPPESIPATFGASSHSRGKAKKDKGDPSVKEIIHLFFGLFKEKQGIDFFLSKDGWKRFGGMLKPKIEEFGSDVVKRKVEAYFKADWVETYSPEGFIGGFNTWAQRELREEAERRKEEEEYREEIRGQILRALKKEPIRRCLLQERAWFDLDGDYGDVYTELVETEKVIESNELGFWCSGLKKFGERQFEDHRSRLEEEWEGAVTKMQRQILRSLIQGQKNREQLRRSSNDYETEAFEVAFGGYQKEGKIKIAKDELGHEAWEITEKGRAEVEEKDAEWWREQERLREELKLYELEKKIEEGMRVAILKIIADKGPLHEDNIKSQIFPSDLSDPNERIVWGRVFQRYLKEMEEKRGIRSRPDLGRGIWDLPEDDIELWGFNREERDRRFKGFEKG